MNHAITDHDDELTADEELLAACLAHLSNTHTTLWGQHWNIIDPKQRYRAAEWLADQIKQVVR